MAIGATGFDQADTICRVLRQAAREDAPGRPGTNDDVVELPMELGRCAAQAGGPKVCIVALPSKLLPSLVRHELPALHRAIASSMPLAWYVAAAALERKLSTTRAASLGAVDFAATPAANET